MVITLSDGTKLDWEDKMMNAAGKKIEHPRAYFESQIRRVGYMHTKRDLRARCHIFIFIL